jgi:hypothetical protein
LVFGIDRWFVIEGKAHGQEGTVRGYPLDLFIANQ